jgi:hypothetical protein
LAMSYTLCALPAEHARLQRWFVNDVFESEPVALLEHAEPGECSPFMCIARRISSTEWIIPCALQGLSDH